MSEPGRNLAGFLLGTDTAAPASDVWTSKTGWTKERVEQRVRSEALKQKVDPDLAVAVAYHESGFDPDIEGDGGNAHGVFQLHKGAATDAGINPKFRKDPDLNIYAGVRYLKMKLDQSKGNVDEALSRYNRGTPDYRGIGDPNYIERVKRYYKPEGGQAQQPQQQPGFLARLGSALSPASAEAASPAGRNLAETASPPSQGAPGGGRNLTDLLLGPATPQTPPQGTGGTTAPPPVVSQTAPTPQTSPRPQEAPQTPDTSWTPGMRFQALPSITQLEPADRAQKTKLFESLNPQMQQEFLRSEEPQAASLAVGGGGAATPQPVTDPAALLAVGGKPVQTREQKILAEARARPRTPVVPLRPGVPTIEQETLEEGITKPSTMIPLLMPGAGIKAVTPLLSKAGPLITRGARAAAEGLSQTAGWTAGRTAETGEVPSPGEIGKEAALNVATGGLVEIPGALRDAKNAVLRATPGAQILLNQRAVQEAEGLGKRVFNAQDKEVVGKAFDAVVATGEKLDTAPIRDVWRSLTPAEQRIAGNELNKISSTFTDALKTRKLADWDIGDLQHLRSELRTASLSKRTPETQDLLQSLRSSVDEAIHNGMAKGSLPAAELVAAQKAYRKVMQAEDLQGLVTRYTKDSPNLKWQELNLAALNKELRGGGKKSTQRLVAGMDATERQMLQQEMDSLARHYPFVKISASMARLAEKGGWVTAGGALLHGNLPVAASAALASIVSAAARSPNVMSIFKRSIIEGQGRLAQHHIDALLNAIRHENEGEAPAQ